MVNVISERLTEREREREKEREREEKIETLKENTLASFMVLASRLEKDIAWTNAALNINVKDIWSAKMIIKC